MLKDKGTKFLLSTYTKGKIQHVRVIYHPYKVLILQSVNVALCVAVDTT